MTPCRRPNLDPFPSLLILREVGGEEDTRIIRASGVAELPPRKERLLPLHLRILRHIRTSVLSIRHCRGWPPRVGPCTRGGGQRHLPALGRAQPGGVSARPRHVKKKGIRR